MHDIPANMQVLKTASSHHIQHHDKSMQYFPTQNALFSLPLQKMGQSLECVLCCWWTTVWGWVWIHFRRSTRLQYHAKIAEGAVIILCPVRWTASLVDLTPTVLTWYPPTHPIPIPLGGGSSNPHQIGAPKSSTYLGKRNTLTRLLWYGGKKWRFLSFKENKLIFAAKLWLFTSKGHQKNYISLKSTST